MMATRRFILINQFKYNLRRNAYSAMRVVFPVPSPSVPFNENIDRDSVASGLSLPISF